MLQPRTLHWILLIGAAALALAGCDKSASANGGKDSDVVKELPASKEGSKPSATPAAKPAAAPSLVGSYTIVSSTSPQGGKPYTGSVDITREGAYHALNWKLAGGENYGGVGVLKGNLFGVGWGTGKNYGVVVYQQRGGTLEGVWASSQTAGKLGSEVLKGAAELGGSYTITSGRSPATDAKYSGTVTITPSGELYKIAWALKGGASYRGAAIKRGDRLIAGWGLGGGAGVVAYAVSADKLDGVWGGPQGGTLGTEVLKLND